MKRRTINILLPLLLLASCQALEPVAPALEEERPQWLPPSGGFEWVKAGDVEDRVHFLRNFGVGYSYNAVRGSYCDWTDIRCQVVNRRALEDFQELSGEYLVGGSTARSSTSHTQFNYSKRDYIAAVHIETKEKIDIGLYKKEKRRRQHFIEDGVEESFYYSLTEEHIMADMFISPANVLYYVNHDERCDNFLTLSFINAVLHVAESDPTNFAVVDSLINIYGTHVITQAWLGGKIRVDLENYMWRFKDVAQEESWDSSNFLNAVKGKDVDHTGKDEYKWLENARLLVTAYGGDQSSLTGLLGEHSADGSRTFSTDGISQWRQSLFFDPQNESGSNVELVDMRLTPIWEFADAVDHDAAIRIKAAIQQDISLQQSLLGENNFFDTSFPIRYPGAGYEYNDTNAWMDGYVEDTPEFPIVVNVVSGGRYVASVCHETIGTRDLWVCYPIYEGKIKQPCGVGVDSQGRVFSVQWLNGKVTVTQLGSARAVDRFYITGGEIGVTPEEGVTYAPSQWMPYVELSGGIQPDGRYNVHGKPVRVLKDGADFSLLIDLNDFPDKSVNQIVEKIVGWEIDGTRSANYTYIYNPKELRPYDN